MPASKKDLKKLQQKKNVAAGIGDKDGKLPSNNKVTRPFNTSTLHKALTTLMICVEYTRIYFQKPSILMAIFSG